MMEYRKYEGQCFCQRRDSTRLIKFSCDKGFNNDAVEDFKQGTRACVRAFPVALHD